MTELSCYNSAGGEALQDERKARSVSETRDMGASKETVIVSPDSSKSNGECCGIQNVPMIMVEQASLVSGFQFATEDPVYTPPGDESLGCSMEDSFDSTMIRAKSTTVFAPKEKKVKRRKGPWYRPSVTCIPIFIIILLIGLVVMVPIILDKQKFRQAVYSGSKQCKDPCVATIVESIPLKLVYPSGSPLHPSIFSSWLHLLDSAKSSIKIASSYWSLRGVDVPDMGTNSSWQGEEIFKRLFDAGKNKKIKIKIAQDKPNRNQPDHDTEILAKEGAAEVRSLNMKRLTGGILHTKMWLIDDQHFYLGSANLDWRSLTQVKELGILVQDCSCLGKDMAKIFEVYWMVGGLGPNQTLPKTWPSKLETSINSTSPLDIVFNRTQGALTYLSSSPPSLSPVGREQDVNAIVKVIRDARLFIHIAVMDYVPAFLYRGHEYWPIISDELKSAAIDRRVQIKLLMSNWTHTRPDIVSFLQSFSSLDGAFGADIKVKLFTVPAFDPQQAQIPYARVNHNKYMVTDNCAYIGTSNWSADYFVNTGGIGIVINQTVTGDDDILGKDPMLLKNQLAAVFDRDWDSGYAHRLPSKPVE